MSKNRIFTTSALAALLGSGALFTAPSAHALIGFVNLWQQQYPASLSEDNATPDGCQLCHNQADGRGGKNPYGLDWRDAWPSSSPTTDELNAAFVAIEGLDSDSDPTGSSNIVEINADTQPGWAVGDAAPGVIGDLDPVEPVPDECVASVDTASLDFGPVVIDNTATLTATITNNGGATCTVDASVVDSGEFTLASASNFTVDPTGSADVSVDYTPVDLGADTGQLRLSVSSPDDIISIPLSGSGVEAPVEVVDLDIKQFKVTKKVSLTKGQPAEVGVQLTVQNGGVTEGSAMATVIGVQGDLKVYEESMEVTDPVGNGSTKFTFPAFTPTATGDIAWTAVIDDGDPDDDTATATTTVSP